MNKAMIESYLRNLVGQLIAAIAIVDQTSKANGPFEFTTSDWLLVANVLWGALIPTAIRYFNKNDAAFGQTLKLVAAPAPTSVPQPAAKVKPAAAKVKKPVAKKKAAPAKKKSK